MREQPPKECPIYNICSAILNGDSVVKTGSTEQSAFMKGLERACTRSRTQINVCVKANWAGCATNSRAWGNVGNVSPEGVIGDIDTMRLLSTSTRPLDC